MRIGQILKLNDYGMDVYLWPSNFYPPKGFGLGQLTAEIWPFLDAGLAIFVGLAIFLEVR